MAQFSFLASTVSSIRAMSAARFDLLRDERETPGLHQVQAHPPILHPGQPTGLQEQLHHQHHFRDAPVLLHHVRELARQDRDRKPWRINPLLDRPLLQLIHDVRDPDLARTLDRAGITRGAQPDGVAPQHLVLEIRPRQLHHLPRRVIHVDAQADIPPSRSRIGCSSSVARTRAHSSLPCRIR